MRGQSWRHDLLTAFSLSLSVKMAVLCAVASSGLVEIYQRCRATCCLLHRGDK